MSVEGRLAARVGPILSDGTPLRDLIDLDKHEVSMRVFHDPEIYRLELNRIFGRAWIFLAHESEIPEVGDFVTRTIGEDPVIVTRTADGEIAILLNVCSHRGMPVCRVDAGNAATFKCPYHGWAYEGTGRLLGAPFEREMYGDWDKSQFGLLKARVATHLGMIFGSFGASTPSLDDYLGDWAWYFDEFTGQAEFKVIGPPVEELMASNWKLSAEQTMGDAYHSVTLHTSARELGFVPAIEDPYSAGIDCVRICTPEGHWLGGNPGPAPAYFKSVGDTNYPVPADWYTMVGALFPASVILSIKVPVEGGRTHQMGISFYLPRGPGGMINSNLPVVAKDAPADFAAQSRTMGGVGFGLIASGDFDAWPSIQSATRGAIGNARTYKYNSFAGPNKPEGWPGPGTVYSGITRDDIQWNFWLRWLEYMTAED